MHRQDEHPELNRWRLCGRSERSFVPQSKGENVPRPRTLTMAEDAAKSWIMCYPEGEEIKLTRDAQLAHGTFDMWSEFLAGLWRDPRFVASVRVAP